MAVPQPLVRHSRESVLRLLGDRCPICDQPIPNEKAEEARHRIEARDRALSEAATARAAQQFATEKAEIDAANRELVERIRTEAAKGLATASAEMEARVTVARDEERKAAESSAQERIVALEQTLRGREADLQEKLTTAESEKRGALRQFETLKADHESEVGRRVQEVRDALDKDKT